MIRPKHKPTPSSPSSQNIKTTPCSCKVTVKLECYHPLDDNTSSRTAGGSTGGRSVAIAAGECSTDGGGGSGDGGTGSGPGGIAGVDTCHTSGGTGGVGETTCKVAPPSAVRGGASNCVRGDAHVTSGETVYTTSRGRTPSSTSYAVREEKLFTPKPFKSCKWGQEIFFLVCFIQLHSKQR